MADTSAGRLVSFLVEGEDVVSCEICMEPFEGTRRPPKLLPCGHNFCQKCICSICFNQELNFAESMNCPTCRASFHISIAKNAPTNYDLCKVLESVQRGTEMANVTVIQVAAQPKDELSPPLRLLAQKSCALRHKKCSDCRRKLPSKTLVKTSRFCELCNTLETMKFTCLECCINRHNGHTLVTVRDLESNQLKAVSELRDARRKLIEKSEAFDRRLGQIGLQGHAASVASQKRHVFEELLGNNTETMRKLEAARLVSGAGLRNLRSEQVHDLSKLTKLCSVLEKTIVVERQPDKLSKSSSAFRQSRLTLRSDDSLAREVLINLLCVLPTNTLTNTLSMFVRSCSPKDTVEERMTIYFHCAKITTEILNGGVRVEDVCLIAESLLNCFYQLNILSRKRNEKGKMSRSNIWKLVQYSYSLVMAIITKAYPAYHPDRVEIIDDLAFLCHSYSDVCDQASIALITIEAARARCAESNLSAEDQKRTLERLTLIDDHLIELRRMQRLTDLRSKTTTRSTGVVKSFWRRIFQRC